MGWPRTRCIEGDDLNGDAMVDRTLSDEAHRTIRSAPQRARLSDARGRWPASSALIATGGMTRSGRGPLLGRQEPIEKRDEPPTDRGDDRDANEKQQQFDRSKCD